MTERLTKNEAVLIARYLDHSLSEEQAAELCQYMEEKPQLQTMLARCVLIDSQLAESRETPEKLQNNPLLVTIAQVMESQQSLPVPTDTKKEELFWPNRNKFDFDFIYNMPQSPNTITVPCLIPPEDPPLWKTFFHPSKGVSLLSSKPVRRITTIVACLILLVVGIIYLVPSGQKEPVVTTNHFIARVVKTIDPVWNENGKIYKDGEIVGTNKLLLESGKVKILFQSGVEVILIGPVEFTVNNEMSGYCQTGNISVNVPPSALGFQISTPFGKVTDFGTEFAINVAEKNIDVEVVKGKVGMTTKNGYTKTLTKGESLFISTLGKLVTSKGKHKYYYSPQHFQENVRVYEEQKKEELAEQNRVLDRTRGMLARFDFTEKSDLCVVNRALYGGYRVSDLEITNGQWQSGQLEGTTSFQMNSIDDEASFQCEGTLTSATLIVRARPDDFANQANVLLASEDFFQKPGAFVWQINRNGSMQLQITGDTEDQHDVYDTPPFITSSILHTWTTFALVVDARNRVVRQYVDGRLLANTPWNHSIPLKPGRMIVGNTMNRNSGENNRNFIGAFDEIRIYDHVVSHKEILRQAIMDRNNSNPSE